MATDLGWYQRMADRAHQRAQAAAGRERLALLAQAKRNAPRIPTMPEEDELVDPMDRAHIGHRVHFHPAHLGVQMCSCGEATGLICYIPPGPDDPPLPERCEICDAHRAARER